MQRSSTNVRSQTVKKKFNLIDCIWKMLRCKTKTHELDVKDSAEEVELVEKLYFSKIKSCQHTEKFSATHLV